jgi:hypothetical protein
MTRSKFRDRLALAMHPMSRGFAFVVLESPDQLVDWGTRRLAVSHARPALSKVSRLIEQYAPDVLVLEQRAPHRHGSHFGDFNANVRDLVTGKGIQTPQLSKQKVLNVFASLQAESKVVAQFQL